MRGGLARRGALVLVGGSEGQRLRNLGDGQLILSRKLRWRQAPGAGGDYERRHGQTCPAHDGRRLAARAAAVGDVRERGIIEALAQGSDLLGHGPEDELEEWYNIYCRSAAERAS
jgi:hypothetical protein